MFVAPPRQPILGSPQAYTTRARRAMMVAPEHMGQGSLVT